MSFFSFLRKNKYAIVRRVLRATEIKLKRKETFLPPNDIYIEPTNKCNLDCSYCMHSIGMERPKGNMDFDIYTKIIDDACGKVNKVRLLGQGEPLLHPRIFEMIEYAKDKGLDVHLNSNATPLTENNVKSLIDAGLDSIYISFDQPDEDSWVAQKSGTAQMYELAKENTLRAIDLAKENGNPHIQIGFIEFRGNEEQVKEHVDFWSRKLGDDGEVSVQDLINMWGALDDDPSLEWYRDMKEKDPNEDSYPVCRSPWTNFIIFWDGRVNACSYDANGRQIVGDVNEESFLDVWNGEKAQRVRGWCLDRQFDETGENGAICKNCNILFDPMWGVGGTWKEFYSRIFDKGVLEDNQYTGHRGWGKLYSYDFEEEKWLK